MVETADAEETVDTEKTVDAAETARCRGSRGNGRCGGNEEAEETADVEGTVDAVETAVAEGWFDAGDTKDAVYVEMPVRNAQ